MSETKFFKKSKDKVTVGSSEIETLVKYQQELKAYLKNSFPNRLSIFQRDDLETEIRRINRFLNKQAINQ